MTSKKSSLNPFRFTYFRNIKGKWPVGVSVFIIVAIKCWEIFSDISQYNYAIRNKLDDDWALNLKNEYTFIFSSHVDDSELDWLFFEVLLLILAGVLSIILFKYLLSKSEINVTFSLGISRTRFFLAKYLAGATVLSAGVILPLFIACIANVCFFGNSAALWISAGYISLKLISAMLWIFTCFALTMTLVGSILETFVMGAVVTFSPAFISRVSSAFMTFSANGSPYSFNTGLFSYFGGLVDMKNEPIDTDINILDFSKYITPISADSHENFLWLSKGAVYDRPPVLFSFIFLAVIIVLTAAAALIVAKRPAEKAGFMGTSPVLQGFCVLTVGPWLSTMCVEIAKEGLMSYRLLFATFIIASLVIMAVGYSVVDLICVRSLGKFRSRIKYLLIELAIFAVITGAFAAVTNIRFLPVPKAEDIKSVSVSVSDAYAYSDMAYMRMGFYDGDSGTRLDELLSIETNESVLIKDITDSDVIGKVIAMNKELKKCNKQKAGNVYNVSGFGSRVIPSRIMIVYTLRSGKQVSRAYNRMTDEMLMTVSDDILTTEQARETAAYRVRQNVVRGYGIAYISPNGSSITFSKAFSHNGMTPIKPGYYSEGEEEAIISANKAQEELYDAIAKDIIDGTLPLNMKSDEEIMGYICYSLEEEYGFDEQKMIPFNANSLFPVYPSMKNTLAVLEKYGEADMLENTAHPVRITYTVYNKDTDYIDSENSGMVGSLKVDEISKNGEIVFADEVSYEYDGAYEGKSTYEYHTEHIEMGEKTVTVTDPAKIAELEKAVCLRSLTRYGGYYARMDYEDGSAVFCYIPSYNMK